MKMLLAVLFLFPFVASAAATEGGGESRSALPTDTKKIGLGVGIGDPFPGLLGINGAYQLARDIRVTAGYAEVEVTTSMSISESGFESKKVKAQTYALGGQYLLTDWAVRPNAGLHAGYFSVSGDGDFSINGFDKSTFHMYSNIGIDWVSRGGFQLATGMNVALLNGSGAGWYGNLGWFF